jgi:uncharacterized protein (TIGR03437 family)
MNVRIPAATANGSAIPLTFSVGGIPSRQTVTVAIR